MPPRDEDPNHVEVEGEGVLDRANRSIRNLDWGRMTPLERLNVARSRRDNNLRRALQTEFPGVAFTDQELRELSNAQLRIVGRQRRIAFLRERSIVIQAQLSTLDPRISSIIYRQRTIVQLAELDSVYLNQLINEATNRVQRELAREEEYNRTHILPMRQDGSLENNSGDTPTTPVNAQRHYEQLMEWQRNALNFGRVQEGQAEIVESNFENENYTTWDIPPGYWRMKNRRYVKISDMTDGHLERTILMLQRKNGEQPDHHTFHELVEERNKRKGTDKPVRRIRRDED